jgi:RNA recognition motif-containing protein
MTKLWLHHYPPLTKFHAPKKMFAPSFYTTTTVTMSRNAESSSGDEVEVTAKPERRLKKEKKRNKSEKAAAEADSSTSEEVTETPGKKRKREALPDEIEIDVSLPEPASKKAARKLKKAKLNPAPTASNDAGTTTDVKVAGEGTEDKDKSAKRSEYGVWIGNLPWSATKESLRKFLIDNAEMKGEHITRVHLPPPTKPPNPNWTTKPLNKGFAYVDFSTELAMYSAIALTETKMDGRALLIKNAKSFEGRPDKPKTEEEEGGRGKAAGKPGHPPNKRIFVGNLSFDVTKEELQTHFSQCGPIEHLHMATFEDSGKCKGYAWVTFGDVGAATSAVKGFTFKTEVETKGAKKAAQDGSEDEKVEVDAKKGSKKRKWLLNKLMGRELRCEFAEDSTTRYNKRYGKDKEPEAVDGVDPGRWKNFGKDKRDGRERPPRKVDPRTIRSGAAHSSAQRASHAIVEGRGKKTTFE